MKNMYIYVQNISDTCAMSNGRLYTSISCTGVQFLTVKLQLKLERMYVSYIKKDKYCPSAAHVNVLFRGPPLVLNRCGLESLSPIH